MVRDEPLHEGASSAPLTGEEKLAAILNSVWEAVITVERNHRISSFNRAAEHLVGVTASEATGKDCREILKANFGPAQHDCPMGDLTEGGKPRTDVDGTLVRADGRIVPISASWAFLEDPTEEGQALRQGHLRGAVGDASRVRAVRACEGGLRRSDRRQDGQVRGRRRGDDLPRRD